MLNDPSLLTLNIVVKWPSFTRVAYENEGEIAASGEIDQRFFIKFYAI